MLLFALKKRGPSEYSHGICNSVEAYLGKVEWSVKREVMYNLMPNLFRSWKKFNGSIRYPVPSGVEYFSEYAMYANVSPGEMWNPNSQYGANRLELLDHMIKTLKEWK